MKHMLILLITAVVLIVFTFPAVAVTSTEEKSRQYQAAINELETYLENNDSGEGSLYGIQSVFASLGGFEHSKGLYYYTTALIKLSEDTYDFDLLSKLELLNLDIRFQDFLNDALKGSSLCSVEELNNYAEGREKEYNGDSEGAMDCYKNCMSYFDASERYQVLREDKYRQIYDQALEKQNAGDLAGAYSLFSDITPYEQSEDYKEIIIKLLGYTPESPTDNLIPVTDVEVTSVEQTEIALSWKASAHAKTYEVQYRESGSVNWTSLGETEDTTYTVSGLKANTKYEFIIIAAIGKIKAEGAVIGVGTAEPTPTPTPKLTPTPTPELEPAMASVSAPAITIAGQSAGGDAIAIEDDGFHISWAADGDVDSYYVRITDGNGNDIAEPQRMTQTSVSLRSGNMEEGMVYTLTVGAIPAGGTDADMVTSQARFIRPVQATPEPTEEPRAAQVGKPVINIGGSAYQRDGISVMTDSSIIISWSAEGDVESYNIYVENQSGERQSLGTTTDTSRTVSTGSLPAGVYTVYVGALPAGGGEDDIQWASARFGIPAPAEAPAEAPAQQDEGEWDAPEGNGDFGDYAGDDEGESEGEPTVGAAAMSDSVAIDANTDADTIQQLQMRLYGMGLLSPDGLEAGVLDARTLQAVAEFQTRWNEQYQAGFEVIDPDDLSTKIDAATVRAIFAG